MTKKQLDAYRLKLLRLLKRLRPDALSIEDQARSATGGEAGGGLSNAPMHLGDMASAVLNQELAAVVLENEQHLLHEMHAAVTRIEEGSYGRCELCGEEIENKRLTAIPYARCCLLCAEQEEVQDAALNLNSGRPKWETDTIAADDKLIEQRDPGDGAAGFTNPAHADQLRRSVEDAHAAGTPGGGSAIGGLAGTNFGRGNPDVDDLAEVMGSGDFDPDDPGDAEATALAGGTGGAVGGTPPGKRSRPSAARSKARTK